MLARTGADLFVPPLPLLLERRPWIEQQNALFAKLDAYMFSPQPSQRRKLEILAYSVMLLAQVQLMLGTPASIVVEHSAELLETRYLRFALTDNPELQAWFAP